MVTWVRPDNSVEQYKIVQQNSPNLNPKTIVKWRKRSFTKDVNMGPKHPRSTVLTLEEDRISEAYTSTIR